MILKPFRNKHIARKYYPFYVSKDLNQTTFSASFLPNRSSVHDRNIHHKCVLRSFRICWKRSTSSWVVWPIWTHLNVILKNLCISLIYFGFSCWLSFIGTFDPGNIEHEIMFNNDYVLRIDHSWCGRLFHEWLYYFIKVVPCA